MSTSNSPQRPSVFFGRKMTIRQTMTIGIVLLALAVAVGANQFSSTAAPSAAAVERDERLASVQTTMIEPVTSYQQRQTYTGIIKARRVSDMSFERSARLMEVAVDEGDNVEKGQLLARLDTRHLLTKQRELQGQRDQAAAVLEELAAGPRAEIIAAAKAQVKELQAQLELQNADLRRDAVLRKRNALSQERYDESKFGQQGALARLEAAQHRLDELLAGTRKEQIEAQRAVVARLDASLADVRLDLDDSILSSPFAGKISERYLDEGTVVDAGRPIVRLIEDGRLEAWIGLPATMADAVRSDRKQQILVGNQRVSATVRTLTPELDLATRTQSLVLDLRPHAAHNILPGQLARLEVADTVEVKGYWLPTSALTRGERGLWSAMAVQPDANGRWLVQRRDVEVLYTDGERCLVRGTLTTGDRVVVAGTHRIVNGQKVSVDDAATTLASR